MDLFVTVFYGHIHQENHRTIGRIAHHAATSLIFPLPAPHAVPKKAPMPWNAEAPWAGLGFRTVAEAVGLAPKPERGLRERAFGVFEGLTWAEIERDHPAQSERWRRRDPDFGPAGGEVLADFYARCVACVTALAERHPGEVVAMVAHGGVLDCLYRAATRVDLRAPRSWQLGNASINRLLHTPQGLTLVGWADTGHLDGAVHDEFSDAGANRAAQGKAA